MIRRITGTVVDIAQLSIVVDVQGIGYLIYVPNAPAYTLDTPVTLFTHQAVRETALDLYGFGTRDALELFELLLGLPKIGPKSFLQVLAQADIELLRTSVLSNDPAHLSKMSGMGKKTAEKVVTGLKDTFENSEAMYATTTATEGGFSNTNDAIDALITLGYPQSDARKVVQQLQTDKPQVTSANDVVKEALKLLG